MPRQGLSRESVIKAAIVLIEEQGIAQFSMGELARRLGVKPASLYNHVKSLEYLRECVGEEVIRQLVQVEDQAIEGKKGDAALFSLAQAHRHFAKEHVRLYQFIMALPQWQNPTLEQHAEAVIVPILKVLSGYGLSTTQQYHWQRILRSMMVGFAFHEQAHDFARFPADAEESFRISIQCLADGLRQAGGVDYEK